MYRRLLRAVPAGAAVVCLLAAAPAARAQCVCGNGDGRFTTHSGIGIDGAFADWAAVLADGDNNSCDGGPGVPPVDLDAPVQSTGRDLVHFAYTWDDAAVQAYTGRIASAKNSQRFIYYADLDNDGLMETGERVIVATWKGSNRSVNLYLGTYQASGGGDPMVDGGGMADGYSLPGTIVNLPSQGNPDYSGTWGASSGLSMEWEVPWADAPGAPGLGLAQGTAFTFHVSSTNSQPGSGSFPAQIDDNMAGCGGGPAGTQYAGVTLDPDRALVPPAGNTPCAAHVVTNTGNGDDRFDLTAAVSGDHVPGVTFHADTDGDGILDVGEPALTDTDGSGEIDTGPLAPGQSLDILVCYATGAPDTGTAVAVLTATSAYDDRIDDLAVDTVTLLPAPDVVVTKTAATLSDPVQGPVPTAKAIPGGVIEYTLLVENQGPGDADSVAVTDALPVTTRLYVLDVDGPGSGPVAFTDGSPGSGLGFAFGGLADGGDAVEFSADSGASFGYVPSPDADGFDGAVTHVRVRPAGSLAGSTGGAPGFTLRFRVGVR